MTTPAQGKRQREALITRQRYEEDLRSIAEKVVSQHGLNSEHAKQLALIRGANNQNAAMIAALAIVANAIPPS
jgi:hypothetical protein